MSTPGPPISDAMLDAAVDMIGRAGLRGSVAVAGTSMHPTFSGAGRLAVEFSPQRLAFGDVVVFRQRGKLVVHRLLRRRADGKLKMRGDGTIGFDPLVEPGDVVGRVFALEYPGGLWRGVRGRRARVYAALLGLHDLCWGLLGGLALKLAGETWRWRVGRLDALKLGVVHALLFRALNPVVEPPALDAVSGHVEARCYTFPFVRFHEKNAR